MGEWAAAYQRNQEVCAGQRVGMGRAAAGMMKCVGEISETLRGGLPWHLVYSAQDLGDRAYGVLAMGKPEELGANWQPTMVELEELRARLVELQATVLAAATAWGELSGQVLDVVSEGSELVEGWK